MCARFWAERELKLHKVDYFNFKWLKETHSSYNSRLPHIPWTLELWKKFEVHENKSTSPWEKQKINKIKHNTSF